MNIGFEIDDMIGTPLKCLTSRDEVDKQVVVEKARDMLLKIREAGHQVTLYTRRDVSVGLETETWLQKNRIPYDRISFNRPHSLTLFFAPDVRKFVNWDDTKEELIINGVIKRDERDADAGAAVGGRAVGDTSGEPEGKKEVEDESGGEGGSGQEKMRGIQILK